MAWHGRYECRPLHPRGFLSFQIEQPKTCLDSKVQNRKVHLKFRCKRNKGKPAVTLQGYVMLCAMQSRRQRICHPCGQVQLPSTTRPKGRKTTCISPRLPGGFATVLLRFLQFTAFRVQRSSFGGCAGPHHGSSARSHGDRRIPRPTRASDAAASCFQILAPFP